jgi:hypothetical protein
MGQIFVSYSRKDKSFVDQLARDLQQSGVDIWIDRKGIEGGERWRATIVDAIRACDAFLIVLSPQSVASDNVAKELALGDRHRRRIIPVLYQSCEIPPQMEYQLAELQHIDFVADYNEALGKLVRALGAHDFMPPAEEEVVPELPQFPPSTPTSPPPGLMQILPGTWQVQIGSTMTGIVGQMTIELGPNYYFRGQLATAMTVSSVAGQWQLLPMNQLALQGQENMGYQVGAYSTVVQFTQISPNQLAAVTSAGEQTFWQRVA